MFSAQVGLDQDPIPVSLIETMEGLYRFFDRAGNIPERIEARLRNPFSDFYQADDKSKDKTFDELIIYILDNFNIDFITPAESDDTITAVCADNCIKWNDFNRYVFDQTRLPRTLEQYCESITAIHKLSAGPQRDHLLAWVNQFNIEHAYEKERNDFEDDFNQNIKDLNNISESQFNTSDLSVFNKHVIDVLKLRNRFIANEVWIASVACAFAANHELIEIHKDIEYIRDRVAQIWYTFQIVAEEIEENYHKLMRLKKKVPPEISAAIKILTGIEK